MRISIEEIMEKLGVDRILYAYETQPWFLYDEEKGITCCAEVRMGPEQEDLETEIQFIYDDDTEREVIIKEIVKNADGEDEETTRTETTSGGQVQMMIMRLKPAAEKKWSAVALRVKGEDYYNKFHNWDTKACDFFRAAIEAIQMGELPDIDELLKTQLSEDDQWGGGGRRGRVGRKSPKANASALLGMKR